MLHASPDLDRLRTITDQALHGHHTHGIDHPPRPLVTIAAEHLDVLLRNVDPEQLGASTTAHNRAMHRAAQHRRCIDSIATGIDALTTALAKGDLTAATNASRNLVRLVRQLKETAAR